MEKINRPPAPNWLLEKSYEWGKEWVMKLKKDNNADFSWPQNNNKGYNNLKEALLEMTKGHCSYCDASPMPGTVAVTIDHFKPKRRFPKVSYVWCNLFPCCPNCQKRGDKYDKKLLKPDTPEYNFYRYFDIIPHSGEIIPNKHANKEDQARASITILLFRLNVPGKPVARKNELKKYENCKDDPDINDFAYRFFIKAGT